MTDNRRAWETVYQRRGQLWAGSVPDLPVLPPRARVLEIGCGNGKTFLALLQKGWDAIALDFSSSAARTARNNTSVFRSAAVILADARMIPLRTGSCDAVFASHIIGHMTGSGRIRIAEEITRVIRPGGVVHFTEFSRNDFRSDQGVRIEEGTFMRGTGISTHYFYENEVSSLFPGLACTSLITLQWDLKVRGKTHTRSEICAVFTAPS